MTRSPVHPGEPPRSRPWGVPAPLHRQRRPHRPVHTSHAPAPPGATPSCHAVRRHRHPAVPRTPPSSARWGRRSGPTTARRARRRGRGATRGQGARRPRTGPHNACVPMSSRRHDRVVGCPTRHVATAWGMGSHSPTQAAARSSARSCAWRIRQGIGRTRTTPRVPRVAVRGCAVVQRHGHLPRGYSTAS